MEFDPVPCDQGELPIWWCRTAEEPLAHLVVPVGSGDESPHEAGLTAAAARRAADAVDGATDARVLARVARCSTVIAIEASTADELGDAVQAVWDELRAPSSSDLGSPDALRNRRDAELPGASTRELVVARWGGSPAGRAAIRLPWAPAPRSGSLSSWSAARFRRAGICWSASTPPPRVGLVLDRLHEPRPRSAALRGQLAVDGSANDLGLSFMVPSTPSGNVARTVVERMLHRAVGGQPGEPIRVLVDVLRTTHDMAEVIAIIRSRTVLAGGDAALRRLGQVVAAGIAELAATGRAELGDASDAAADALIGSDAARAWAVDELAGRLLGSAPRDLGGDRSLMRSQADAPDLQAALSMAAESAIVLTPPRSRPIGAPFSTPPEPEPLGPGTASWGSRRLYAPRRVFVHNADGITAYDPRRPSAVLLRQILSALAESLFDPPPLRRPVRIRWEELAAAHRGPDGAWFLLDGPRGAQLQISLLEVRDDDQLNGAIEEGVPRRARIDAAVGSQGHRPDWLPAHVPRHVREVAERTMKRWISLTRAQLADVADELHADEELLTMAVAEIGSGRWWRSDLSVLALTSKRLLIAGEKTPLRAFPHQRDSPAITSTGGMFPDLLIPGESQIRLLAPTAHAGDGGGGFVFQVLDWRGRAARDPSWQDPDPGAALPELLRRDLGSSADHLKGQLGLAANLLRSEEVPLRAACGAVRRRDLIPSILVLITTQRLLAVDGDGLLYAIEHPDHGDHVAIEGTDGNRLAVDHHPTVRIAAPTGAELRAFTGELHERRRPRVGDPARRGGQEPPESDAAEPVPIESAGPVAGDRPPTRRMSPGDLAERAVEIDVGYGWRDWAEPQVDGLGRALDAGEQVVRVAFSERRLLAITDRRILVVTAFGLLERAIDRSDVQTADANGPALLVGTEDQQMPFQITLGASPLRLVDELRGRHR